MNQPQKPKVGLLCEDANAIEVTDDQGHQRIEKTANRDQTEKELRESKGKDKPIHDRVND